MKKRLLPLLFAGTVAAAFFAGCGGGTKSADRLPADGSTETDTGNRPEEGGASENGQTLRVAAFEGGYGVEMWEEVAKAFEASHPGVSVELTVDKQLEDVIEKSIGTEEGPDVVHLATGRSMALTERLTEEKALLPLTDVLDMQVPGEDVTVREKLIPGFIDTVESCPYHDGVTYYAPMFYSPCGLFYNAGLFRQKGWEVPKTWDEMWELGEKAKAENIALFTYPTTDYLYTFIYSLLSSAGGTSFYNSCMLYEDGIWESENAAKVFGLIGRLAGYTEGTTAANAASQNFLANQQLILDNKALFCPNGTWMPGEMAQAPKADDFEWGFMAVPAVDAGGNGAAYVSCEEMWIPAEAKNQELAKEFVAYMYSDEAARIFAASSAVQPISGMNELLEGDNKMFYGIFDNGVAAVWGGFAPTEPVEGFSMQEALFGTVNRVMTGEITVEDWQAAVEAASDQFRGKLR